MHFIFLSRNMAHFVNSEEEEEVPDLPDDRDKYEYFWKARSPFSQWHPSEFVVDGKTYNCAEQYMIYHKARTICLLWFSVQILYVCFSDYIGPSMNVWDYILGTNFYSQALLEFNLNLSRRWLSFSQNLISLSKKTTNVNNLLTFFLLFRNPQRLYFDQLLPVNYHNHIQ